MAISPAYAQEILVEAPRIDENATDSSRSTSVLGPEAVLPERAATISSLLRAVPGLDVAQQGGPGQTTSIFIRGARSEDTLVLIDGIEVNDPMSPSSGFDFSSLSPDNVERIEVYRGPQGVRFGAGALGGVINIVTTEGQGPAKLKYLAEGGSYRSFREGLGVSGQHEAFAYSLGLSHVQSRGFSAAATSYGNTEADGILSSAASTKLRWELPSRL
ncbi:MAG: TonB-dependent receptor plug domain-containing protein, partial [Bdellovibrionota bacterium]